jgi:hypothetical protein
MPKLPRLFLPVIALTYLAMIASYVFVWIVDPYGLRPWRVPARLADQPYIGLVTPLLFPTAAHDGADLVVLGGSTSAAYTPSMLRKAFPSARHVVNLSFPGASAEDLTVELARLETSKSLKRVIFSLDVTVAKDLPGLGRIADRPPFDGSLLNPVPEFNTEAVEMSARVLMTGILWSPAWQDPSTEQADFLIGSPPITTDPDVVSQLARDTDISRAWVASGPDLPCAAIPNLTNPVKYLRQMADRGVAVDVIFPVYSLALYSNWSVAPPAFVRTSFPGRGSVFSTLVSMRRCAVEMTADEPNIHVYGFDTDLPIVGDLSLFTNTSHLLDPKTHLKLIQRIASGKGVLTKANWPAYEAKLRTEVEEYRPSARAS